MDGQATKHGPGTRAQGLRTGILLVMLAVFLCAATVAHAQPIDPELMAFINAIKAVDNHAHVVALDVPDDAGYDALRCDTLPVTKELPPPANFRFGAGTQAAWLALYGRTPRTVDEADRDYAARTASLRSAHGANTLPWILDRSGVDTVLANRVAMTPSLASPRVRWVSYVDALLFPFDTANLGTTPDRRALFRMEDDVRRMYLQRAGITTLPPTLDEYVAKAVIPTLADQKAAGAVAVKFEAAYLRSLDFAAASPDDADAIYRRAANGSAPKPSDYTLLQNYLFRIVAAEAGKRQLAVHIHTGSGCGEFFDIAGSDPILLDKILSDDALRHTTFVMLHGGVPFEAHIAMMLLKPNAYVDTSLLPLMWAPSHVARVIRPWLEIMPEHVLFGSDAGPYGPGLSWPETTWLASKRIRTALGLALTAMVSERVITKPRAKEIAAAVLRTNATALYHLDAVKSR